jgi:hypothetical protein
MNGDVTYWTESDSQPQPLFAQRMGYAVTDTVQRGDPGEHVTPDQGAP